MCFGIGLINLKNFVTWAFRNLFILADAHDDCCFYCLSCAINFLNCRKFVFCGSFKTVKTVRG